MQSDNESQQEAIRQLISTDCNYLMKEDETFIEYERLKALDTEADTINTKLMSLLEKNVK